METLKFSEIRTIRFACLGGALVLLLYKSILHLSGGFRYSDQVPTGCPETRLALYLYSHTVLTGLDRKSRES